MPQKTYGFLFDFVFKYVFGRAQNAQLLSYLLNALLDRPNDNKISVIEILNPFNLKEFSDDKLSIVDVRAKDEKGALYTIEVQLLSHSKFIERSLYYLARLYSSQIKEGEQFTKLRPTIAISIVNFDLLSAIDELHNVYKMINEKTKTELTDIFELHFVEMTKFKIDKPRSLRTRFEKWLHVLKFGDAMYGGENGLPEELLTEEGIIMAFEEMKKVNADSEMRYIMEARAQAISTIATLEDDYYNKGKIEGQLEAKLEAARNLLDVLDVKTIAEKLGLSVDEVNNLKQSQK
ncbi:MAG: PD-(D/E)XK nuclease family transposase [bacterium ADurb.Bin243]|nr:MAG: PD-(D/E)XK nuclease family transposase [bacterium ADurb.Bin243]